MNKPLVVCYGEIDLDLYLSVNKFPAVNAASYVKQEFANVGGAAGNAAVWLAYWNVSVRLLGHELGNDLDGDEIRAQLAQYPSLDTQYVFYREQHQTPRCQCLVTPDGERTFILHWPEQVAVTPLTETMLRGIQWLNLDMSGALEPRLKAARLARSLNIPVLVNDVYTPEHPLIRLADIIVLSASVVRTKQPGSSIQAIAETIRINGNCDVIVTDGPHAVQAFLKTGANITLKPPRIPVVDTTGAGDIFKAGLLYGLMQQLPVKQALKWAVAAGSAKAGRAGTTADPAPLSIVQALVSSVREMLPGGT